MHRDLLDPHEMTVDDLGKYEFSGLALEGYTYEVLDADPRDQDILNTFRASALHQFMPPG